MSHYIPQIIVVGLYLLSLGSEMAKHGEPKEAGKHNAWSTLIILLIMTSLLWWGGFFDPK